MLWYMFTTSYNIIKNRLHSFASLYSNWLMSNCTVCHCASMVKHPFFRGQRFGISCLYFYQVWMTYVSWWWLVKMPPDRMKSGSERISRLFWSKPLEKWSVRLLPSGGRNISGYNDPSLYEDALCSALTNLHISNSKHRHLPTRRRAVQCAHKSTHIKLKTL